MNDLEQRLTLLRDEIEWPPTPDLTAAVRTRIGSLAGPQARSRPALTLRLALALALAAAVIAAGVSAAVSPDVRAAFKRLLGISGAVRIERVDRLPATGPGGDLQLGAPTTLAAARRGASFAVGVPRALGAPDGVYRARVGPRAPSADADSQLPADAVSMVYAARPGLPAASNVVGLLLTEFGGAGIDYVEKLLGEGVDLQRVTVNGAPGYWIAGPHALLLGDASGQPHRIAPRLAASTLVWTAGNVTYRLETGLSKAGALRIARSVR